MQPHPQSYALYEVTVRQARCLPPASFRFHLTMETLALGCVIPAIRAHSGLAPVRHCSCRAYMQRFPSPRLARRNVLRRYFCGRHLFLEHHFRFILFHPCLKVVGCKQEMYKDMNKQIFVLHGYTIFIIFIPPFTFLEDSFRMVFYIKNNVL